MVALLIEDVTLLKAEQIIVQARFRGGATTTLKLPMPLNAWQGRKTPKHVLAKMDGLLNKFTDAQVADGLNKQGLKTGAGGRFTAAKVRWVRYANGLKSYAQRLKESGILTSQQMGTRFGVSETTVINWRKKGLIQARRCDDRNQWLYFPPSRSLHRHQKKKKTVDHRALDKKSLKTTHVDPLKNSNRRYTGELCSSRPEFSIPS